MARLTQNEKDKWLDFMRSTGRNPRDVAKNETGAPNYAMLYRILNDANSEMKQKAEIKGLNTPVPEVIKKDLLSPGERAILNAWIKNPANRTKLFLLIAQSLED